MAEQMDNYEAATKRELQSTKRELQTTKRELQSTKRELQSTKRIMGTATEYWDFGAPGDYTVMIDGKEVAITSASCIRVLDHGELNILTDKGRWFLFAAGDWKRVWPKQPVPETLEGKAKEQLDAVLLKGGKEAA